MQNALNKAEFKATATRAPQRRSKTPDDREREISVIVGTNMRTLRTMRGMSQMALAEKLGITFQQIQKYEKGLNRVSAPKLVLMAEIFKTPITTFFSNTGMKEVPANALPNFGKQGLRAARIVDTMPPKIQGTALRVLQSLGETNEETE